MSYVRVSVVGQTLGGEVWSINPTFDPSGELETGINQTALDAAALAISNINPGTNMGQGMSNALSIARCRLEVRSDSTDALLALSDVGSTLTPTGTITPKMSVQNAVVFSLRTNTPGGSGRGRVYWPAIGLSIGSNLRLVNATQVALLSEFKTYVGAMKTALTTNFPLIGFDLAVRSKTTKTTPHVVRIQMGDVIDTQRRRRDTLREAYVSTVYP